MILVYFILLCIGTLGSLVSLLGLDGHDVDISTDVSDLHIETDSPKLFSTRVIFSFFIAFGLAGIISVYNGLSIGMQILLSMVAGLSVAFLVYLLFKVMYKQQSGEVESINSLVDLCGYITIAGMKNTDISMVTIDNKEYVCREELNNKLYKNNKVKVVGTSGSTLIVKSIQ